MYKLKCLACGKTYYKKFASQLKSSKYCSRHCCSLHSHKTHGMKDSRLYGIWESIQQRCFNKNAWSYQFYGKKGITNCERWTTFINFYNDVIDSYNEHCKIFGEKNTTIDRINGNKGYSLQNCRWATRKEQGRNRSTNRIFKFKGQSKSMIEWAEHFNLPYYILSNRINNYKWNFEKAINTPYKPYNIKNRKIS